MFQSQKAYLFGKGHSLLIDRKFDTAIRSSQIEAFLQRHQNDTATEDDGLIHVHHNHYNHMKKDTTLLPTIILDLIQQSRSNKTVAQPWSHKLIPLIRENINLQQEYNMTTNPDLPVPQISDILNNISLPNLRLINILMDWSHKLSQFVELLPIINEYRKDLRTPAARVRHRSKVNKWVNASLGLEITWSNHMCVVKYQGETFLQPRPVLLQLHNKINDMISVLIHCSCQAGSVLEHNAADITVEFLTQYHRMHINYPSKFFDVAKCVEGYITSIIIKQNEEWVNNHLFDNIVGELVETTGINLPLMPISHTITSASTPLQAELSCLVKLSGHPLIDIEAGHKKLDRRVHEKFPISIAAVASCISAIKKNYVRNFILRHKRWPAVQIHPENGHPALRYAHRQFLDPYSQEVINKHGRITDEDWAFVELEQELRFSYAENILPILKDKAISVLRSRTFEAYIDKVKPHLNPKETRLLLYYLFTDARETNHIDYLIKYMNAGDDLDLLMDYLVIRVVPKEKELKEEYRGFGCKTFLDRARSIIQEMNAMRYLDLTSDEQAMTLSELQLAKKIYAYRNMRKMYPNHRIIMINFDASGWNNKFRRETVDYVMRRTLDRIYGVNLFGKTHAAYEKTLVVIPDPLHTAHWEGQEGGIEGLNQDTWVITWLAQIKYAFRNIEYMYHLLAKGDDLRACIPIPEYMLTNETVRDTVNDLIQRVSDAAKAFGHEIKVTESYASEIVFAFSKTLYLGNVTLPYSFRKIQKTYGSNNAFLPVIDDYIASSFSNAHSACSATTTVIPCYVVALWWTYYYLLCHPEYKHLLPRELLALTLTPSVVGGLPIIYLHNMFVRAESDLLSAFIGLYQHLKRRNVSCYPYMQHFLYHSVGKVSKCQLAQDPYSLPIQKPMTAANYLKRVTRGILRNKAINHDIKMLFTVYSDMELESFIAALDTSPFWPAKPFAALYACTPYQLMDELITQFVTAKSIKDLLLVARTSGRRTQRILTSALRCDRRVHKWRIAVLRGQRIGSVRTFLDVVACPAQCAQKLRDEMWGKPITTITYPPIQHQIRLQNHVVAGRSPYARANHFTLLFDNMSNTYRGMTTDHFREGIYHPFIGQTTRTGNITPVLRIVDTDPLASKVCTLLMLRDWTNVELNGTGVRSNFHILIDKILECYTQTPAQAMHPFTAIRRSGTSTHRLRAHGFRESIVPNTLQNVYTCMQGESNTHTGLRMDPRNITINFLHIFCYSIVMATYDLNYRQFTMCAPITWIITDPCAYCNQEIVEPAIVLNPEACRNIRIAYLSLTKLSQPLETMIGEALQDFTERGARYIIHELTPEDLPIATEAVIAEVMKQHWSAARRWEQRFRMHHIGPSHVQHIEDLSSFPTGVHLSENDIRSLPMESIFVTLSLAVRDFFEREMKTHDEERINTLLSTMHDSDVPWYAIISLIEECGFLYPFILSVANITGITAPAGAMNRLASAVRYVGRAAYVYAIRYHIRTFVLTMSTIEQPATLMRKIECLTLPMLSSHLSILVDQEHIYEGLIDGDPDAVWEQYLTLCCPIILWEDVQPNIAAQPRSQINILDATRFTIEDLQAINTEQHPRHHLIHYWARQYGEDRRAVIDHVNDMIANTQIEDTREMILELFIRLTIYVVNIGQCIELCRQHPAFEEKRIHPVAVPDEPFAIHDAMPRSNPRHVRGICVNVQYVEGDPSSDVPVDQPMGPVMRERVDNIRFTDMYRTLGSTTTSVCKFIDILRILRWPNPPYRVHGAIYCVGEGEGGIASACLSLFPNCNIIYNSLIVDYRLGQLPGVALLEHRNTQRLIYQTQIEGVSDLREWDTCVALLDQTDRQTVLVHCDAELPAGPQRSSDALRIWLNVAKMFKVRAAAHGVLIIKVFLDIPSAVARLISYLRMEHVWLIHTPTSHPGSEAYVVATTTIGIIGSTMSPPPPYIRYHATHMRSCITMQQVLNINLQHHNEGRAARFMYQVDAIFAWQNIFVPYIPTHSLHLVFDSLHLTHPGLPNLFTFQEYVEFMQASIQSQCRHLIPQLRDSAEFVRNPTYRSQTLMHKTTVLTRYLKLQVAAYLLDTHEGWGPHVLTDDIYDTVDIYHQATDGYLDNVDLPMRLEGQILYIGQYEINIHHLVRDTFKPILRLIGLQHLDCWRL